MNLNRIRARKDTKIDNYSDSQAKKILPFGQDQMINEIIVL